MQYHLRDPLGCFESPPNFARQIDAASWRRPRSFVARPRSCLCCGDPHELPRAQEAPAAEGPGSNLGSPRNAVRSPPVRGPTSHRGCGAIHPGASQVGEQVLVACADLIDGRSKTVQEASPLVSCLWCEHLHPGKHPLSVRPACAAGLSTMRSLEMSGAHTLSDEAIDDVLTRTSPGNYALGYMEDHTFSVFFVGRSDSDVRQRLHKWVGMPSRYEKYASPAKASWEVHHRGRFPLDAPALGRVGNAEASYTRFAYSYARSAEEAYAKEWRNYDAFGGNHGLDNKTEPVRAAG